VGTNASPTPKQTTDPTSDSTATDTDTDTSTDSTAADHESVNRFNPADIRQFRYTGIEIDYAGQLNDGSVTVVFTYELVRRPEVAGDAVTCRETFVFPVGEPVIPPGVPRRIAFERLVRHLGLAAGLSYYKMAAPGEVEIADSYSSEGFTVDEIAFHRRLLAKGLGEFSFVNGLDAELQPRYSFRSTTAPGPLTGERIRASRSRFCAKRPQPTRRSRPR
jgi:hypothetical protein